MKKKLIVAAISSALVAPSAFAAQDDLGMNYTSAAEGFYGSIRAMYESSGGEEDDGARLTSGVGSRLGVQGTNDLGGGMEGYYRVEFNVGNNNGDGVSNRLRYVGLRGGFGEIEAGSFWDDQYNFVTSMSDLSPWHSARYAGGGSLSETSGNDLIDYAIDNFVIVSDFYEADSWDLDEFSIELDGSDAVPVIDPRFENTKAAQEITEAIADLNAAIRHIDDARDHEAESDRNDRAAEVDRDSAEEDRERAEAHVLSATESITVTEDNPRTLSGLRTNSSVQYRTPDLNGFQGSVRFSMVGGVDRDGDGKDDNDLDQWSLSAKYSFQGFTVAGNYQVTQDYFQDITAAGGAGGEGSFGRGSNVNTRAAAGAAGDSDTLKGDDHVFWALGMSYGQDNWSVGGWYGESEARTAVALTGADGDDATAPGSGTNTPGNVGSPGHDGVVLHEDENVEIISVGASVDVDKVTVYGLYEQEKNVAGVDGVERSGANVGVVYRLGSNTNTWVEYVTTDDETVDDEEDVVVIGFRHNF